MEERKQNHRILQWHPAFYAGLQIELEADGGFIWFLKVNINWGQGLRN